MTIAPAQGGTAANEPPTAQGAVPVYVWDLVVRSTHWLIALSMIVLSLTGLYIGRPFLTSIGPANQRFVMGWVKVIHFYGAIVFSLSVGARVVWMFTGTRWARWDQFVPTTRKRLVELVQVLRFYLFLRPLPPLVTGHNPLAGVTYVGVFGLYLVMIFTGFALYSVNAHTSYMEFWQVLLPLFGGPANTRWLHHVTMWFLIGFVVHHVFSALLVSRVERNGTMESIFSGFKFLPRTKDEDR